ncbi:hypothetical protein SNOG_04156 [Parastagonospora nodorum SN15]|uniref:Uncharacterized protein n=1 Tax=Phaeosphaeria nodorum (strain SN15 / ATCC MYA-4574 / FGSC 10173) TaxID=321614 RepID=Q0UVQ8_PHANO|nr:hypothetical protein SNOG_04156 [Parastagonospora nodorum SN15]EAT87916.1 hypothetical protein SNOG_04156 [Parastagonospora nodorum SN15]
MPPKPMMWRFWLWFGKRRSSYILQMKYAKAETTPASANAADERPIEPITKI